MLKLLALALNSAAHEEEEEAATAFRKIRQMCLEAQVDLEAFRQLLGAPAAYQAPRSSPFDPFSPPRRRSVPTDVEEMLRAMFNQQFWNTREQARAGNPFVPPEPRRPVYTHRVDDDDLGNLLIPGGRYSGKTLDEVYAVRTQYLE